MLLADFDTSSRARRFNHVFVVGAGSWGTALAATARRSGADVTIIGRNAQVVDEINAHGRSQRFLPDVPLPEGLAATTDMARLHEADAVMLVVPSGQIRPVAAQMAPHLGAGVPVAVCAKGIEAETGLLMSQVAESEFGERPVGVVSGPTFARETALNHPTAATVAFPFGHSDRLNPQDSAAARFALTLSGGAFRAYISDDLVGVEIGGAVKNVIAIACGMMVGAGFAENTRAALITRGVDEMKTLAEALGGRRETVTGLAGVGDLTLTCSSETSRNMSLGLQLGRGIPRDQCFDGRPVVVEGEANAKSVIALARRVGVRMPISEAVNAVLNDGAALGDTFAQMWSRPIKAEPRAMDLSIENPASEKAAADMRDRLP